MGNEKAGQWEMGKLLKWLNLDQYNIDHNP